LPLESFISVEALEWRIDGVWVTAYERTVVPDSFTGSRVPPEIRIVGGNREAQEECGEQNHNQHLSVQDPLFL